MIFVTVGTHEQPFDRLIKYVDNLKKTGVIQEEVVIQIGFSMYKPMYCVFNELYSYQEMQWNIKNAKIVITHGGPASFMAPLQIGKIPIVVPRQKQFGEHINDHQMEFSKAVFEKYKNIIVVDEIDNLKKNITDYDDIVKDMITDIKNNNHVFNEQFKILISDLFKNE